MTRQLASIRVIDDLTPIEDADRIECAHIGGWTVVVKKGEFYKGGLCIYFEIDSWVPHDVAPFLSSGSIEEGGYKLKYFNDIPGNRLRTKRLKGVLSQGLALPLHTLNEEQADFCQEYDFNDPTGCDLTELLKVQLYEKPLPAQLRGTAKGNFPAFIPKTDQPRIQNLSGALRKWEEEQDIWEVTEKLDGSSMTVYKHEGVFGVCSRNLDLKQTGGNTFWDTAIKYKLESKVPEGYAFQGELVGPGIQGNQYALTSHKYYIFDIFNIAKQEYLNAYDRTVVLRGLSLEGVPFVMYSPLRNSMQEMLEFCKGKSFLNGSIREGLVYKHITKPDQSFKCINNDWLLKYE